MSLYVDDGTNEPQETNIDIINVKTNTGESINEIKSVDDGDHSSVSVVRSGNKTMEQISEIQASSTRK